MNPREREAELKKSITEQITQNPALTAYLQRVLTEVSEKQISEEEVVSFILDDDEILSKIPEDAASEQGDLPSSYMRLRNFLSTYKTYAFVKQELWSEFENAVNKYDPKKQDASIADITAKFYALPSSDTASAEGVLRKNNLYEPVQKRLYEIYDGVVTPMSEFATQPGDHRTDKVDINLQQSVTGVVTKTLKSSPLSNKATPSEYKTETSRILNSLRAERPERLGGQTDLEVIQQFQAKQPKNQLAAKIVKGIGAALLALTGVGLLPLGVMAYKSYKQTGSPNFLFSKKEGKVEKAVHEVEKKLQIKTPRKAK